MDAQAGAARRPDEIHSINIKGQRLRIAIRPGNGTRVPLLLMNGIGVSFEIFQPFIDELDPGIEVIRFDVPAPVDHRDRLAIPFFNACLFNNEYARSAWPQTSRCAWYLLGWWSPSNLPFNTGNAVGV